MTEASKPDAAHEVGVAYLTQALGWPRADAELAMLTSPAHRRMGEALVPVVERMLKHLGSTYRALVDAGLIVPSA